MLRSLYQTLIKTPTKINVVGWLRFNGDSKKLSTVNAIHQKTYNIVFDLQQNVNMHHAIRGGR